MAYEIPGHMITLPAASTSLDQFTFVTVNASGQAAAPADGGAVAGVLQQKPTKVGDAVNVMVDGVSKILAAGSTVAQGDTVATSTSGRATAVGAGEYTIGRILSGSSGSTDRVLTVLIQEIGTT